jgi:hypothetical protein
MGLKTRITMKVAHSARVDPRMGTAIRVPRSKINIKPFNKSNFQNKAIWFHGHGPSKTRGPDQNDGGKSGRESQVQPGAQDYRFITPGTPVLRIAKPLVCLQNRAVRCFICLYFMY